MTKKGMISIMVLDTKNKISSKNNLTFTYYKHNFTKKLIS